jgi:HSP20 family protein
MSNELTRTSETPQAMMRPEQTRTVMFTPRVDIFETTDELLLVADLPGVKPADLELRFDKGELSIHARCAARYAPARWVQQEYEVGDFYRAFAIPQEIDADKIAAELKHGVLMVRLPKSDKVKPKKIAIKGS